MKEIDHELELSALFHLFKKNGYVQEFHVHLQKIIKDYPEILSRWFYEAILRIGDLSANPFSAAFDTKRKFFYEEVAQEIWGDIAKIRINQLNGTKNKRLDGFISLTDVIEDVIEDNPFYQPEFYRSGFKESDFSSFKNYVLTLECYKFSNEIIKICTIVYQGLSLFKKGENDEYLQMNDTDPNFIYIFMNGYYKDIKEIGCYPKWFLGFYFKESQLETHKQFFDGFEGDDESMRIRRIAFRKTINEDDVFSNKQASNRTVIADKLNHSTRLLKIQEKVIVHFYGNQFDIDDPDTWTNQKVILNWLMTNFKLSAREAQSIDIVTRPDQARRK